MQNRTDKSLFGIDINEYTTNVDFTVLARTVDFLYLRGSGSASGRFRVDRKFIQFAGEARNFGIPVGAYHFGVPSNDLTTADSQCDDFIGLLQRGFGQGNYGDLFPVLDVEVPTDKSISTVALVNWIDRFRRRFERATRRRLMLYTGVFFVQLYDNFFVPGRGYPLSNMPLWIALYTAIPTNPRIPPDVGGWTRWRIWQYSESATVAGVGNPVDANWGPNSIDLLVQPDQVNGLSASRVGNRINISWNRNDDVDLSGYNIFANNYWVGTVDANDTSFNIGINQLPFSPVGQLRISIEAFDFDGETSRVRTVVTV
jgi:GH25 family lysozyme M1 (1,4-beta-N-acetylmuramidase)